MRHPEFSDWKFGVFFLQTVEQLAKRKQFNSKNI